MLLDRERSFIFVVSHMFRFNISLEGQRTQKKMSVKKTMFKHWDTAFLKQLFKIWHQMW